MTDTKRAKPSFPIDLTRGAPSALLAHQLLPLVNDSCCFHTSRGLRPPLGIYNVSISRICEKLTSFCLRLEKYILSCRSISRAEAFACLERELLDYIELAIYAAAEHVDDLCAIAKGFFPDNRTMGKDTAARLFLADIKTFRAFISATANAIKHQQARIRLYSIEFSHSETDSVLHGYFIEGVENGVVGPSVVFHQTQKVFSITTLAWEILLLLLCCSVSLNEFLLSSAQLIEGGSSQTNDMFSDAVIAAARLPLYTFDEEHPFAKATFVLSSEGSTESKLDSGMYGSFHSRWKDSNDHKFGNSRIGFVGDGVSKSFSFPSPSKIAIQHWRTEV